MRDYEAILRPLIEPLVENPENILIRELPGGSQKETTILIITENDDTARLIGKRGSVANALREAVTIIGKADNSNQRIHLKFESFEEGSNNNDGE